MTLVADVGLDVQHNNGFTPHNLKTVIWTGMSGKAMMNSMKGNLALNGVILEKDMNVDKSIACAAFAIAMIK